MAPNNLNQHDAFYKNLFNQMNQAYTLVDVIFNINGQPIDVLYIEANTAANQMAGT